MSTISPRFRRARRLLAAAVLSSGLILSAQAVYVQASAASVEWVDGGDDSPCLQDDKGAALTSLPVDKFCTPIGGCYQDDDGKWVLPSRKTGIWQGNPNDVKYADEIAAAPAAPQPTTPKPTAAKPVTAKPTPKATTPGAPSATPTAAAPGLTDPATETAAAAAPTAPAAPTVTVKGSDVTVSWLAGPNAALESVSGYVVQLTNAAPVQVDAQTLKHTFTDLEDGSYRAAVQAVNAAGPSLTSAPSEVATVGTPIAETVGTVAVDGALEPGGAVTITGTGFAADVPELALELHSDPVALGTVATDASGAFTTTVTIPATVQPGDHSVVVLYDGTQITSAPVAIAEAASTTPAKAEPSESVPPVVGLVILLALGALGLASLAWHVATGRRRERNRAAVAPAERPVAADDLILDRPLASSAPGVS